MSLVVTLPPSAIGPGPDGAAALERALDQAAGAPALLVVDGDADGWRDLDEALGERPTPVADALRRATALTVAVLRGPAGRRCGAGLGSLRDAVDLVLVEGEPGRPGGTAPVPAGPASAVDSRLAGWRAAFTSAPAPCVVAAMLLRAGAGVPSEQRLFLEALAYSTLLSGPEFTARAPAATPGQDRTVPVAVVAHEGWHEVRLQRPERHNAVSASLRDGLAEILRAQLHRAQPVALTGAGPSFCSGGDLAEFGSTPAVEALFVRAGRSPAALLDRLRPRLLAAVHGACIGAGVEWAAFARHVIAAEDTVIRLPEASFGLVPGAGGTVSVPDRIGRRAFLDIFVTGRALNAPEALALGLVDEVVPREHLTARLAEVASA